MQVANAGILLRLQCVKQSQYSALNLRRNGITQHHKQRRIAGWNESSRETLRFHLRHNPMNSAWQRRCQTRLARANLVLSWTLLLYDSQVTPNSMPASEASVPQHTGIWLFALTREERATLIATFGGWALDGMDVMIYSFVIPALIAQWHMSQGQAGMLSTVALLLSAAGGWLAGLLADRFGGPAFCKSPFCGLLFSPSSAASPIHFGNCWSRAVCRAWDSAENGRSARC